MKIKPTIPMTVNGNAIAVIGATVNALRRAGLRQESKQFNSDIMSKLQSLTYDQVLAECFKHVDIGSEVQWFDDDEPHLPAGSYIVADPCYLLTEEAYGALLEQQGEIGGWHGVYSVNNAQVAVFGTKHGDGNYEGNRGTYLVDSGHIACVAVDKSVLKPFTIDNDFVVFGKNEKYRLFEISFPFNVYVEDPEDECKIVFGPLESITTGEPKCSDCGGNPEYCECGNCGGCSQYCDCNDKNDEDDDDEDVEQANAEYIAKSIASSMKKVLGEL